MTVSLVWLRLLVLSMRRDLVSAQTQICVEWLSLNDTACPKGKYANSGTMSGTAACALCEDGKYNSEPVQPVCKDDCNAGFYIVEDKSSCVICPYGTWQDLEDQSFCKKCAVGKISKNEQQTSNTTCEECDVGFYNPYEGYDGSCLPCQKAKESGEHESNRRCCRRKIGNTWT